MKESSSSVVMSDLLKSYVDLNGSAKKDNICIVVMCHAARASIAMEGRGVLLGE